MPDTMICYCGRLKRSIPRGDSFMNAPVKNWCSLDCTVPYATLERSTAKRQPKKSWDKSSRPFALASREIFSNRGLSMIFDEHFGVIVIGAGHAGCEAASAAAR